MMTKKELLRLLDRLGIRPSTRLGQNFLIDPNLRDALVREADVHPGERVLEVGPGTGVLTRPLLDAGATVTAVELDRRLCDYLRSELGDHPRFTLLGQDACKLDYDRRFGTSDYKLVANLPYSAGSHLLGMLLDLAHPPRQLFILLQKEVADRLIAKPGSKAYGALSVRSQLLYECRQARVVPGAVFVPPPEIRSAHVCMTLRSDAPAQHERRKVSAVAKAAFSHRRKKLVRVLDSALPATDWADLMQRLQIDEGARADAVPPDLYLSLARGMRNGRSNGAAPPSSRPPTEPESPCSSSPNEPSAKESHAPCSCRTSSKRQRGSEINSSG